MATVVVGHGTGSSYDGCWDDYGGAGGQDGGGDHGGLLSVTAVVFYRAMEVVRTAW